MTQSPPTARPADAQLIAQFVTTRDEAAFRELVQRHLNWVYGVARRLTRDAALADDVTQGVFLALSAKSHKLVGHHHLAGWLFEAARLGASSALRQRARQKERERMAAQNQNPLAMSDLERLELADQLDAAVSKLPAPDRTLILARFYEQIDTAEIARRLNTTPAAVKKRIERAIEKLRERMHVQKPADTFASALAGTAAAIAPQHLGAAVLAGKTTPAALGISASIQWLVGLGAKLLWISATIVCLATLICVVGAATLRARLPAIPYAVTVPIATTPPPSTLPADFAGDVAGPDGKPVPNAEVIIPSENHGRREVLAQTRTDTNGRFTLPANVNLRYAFAFVPGIGITKPATDDDLPIHLQMATPVSAEITLLARGGGPAAGITIQPRTIYFRDDTSQLPPLIIVPDQIAPLLSTTTDASGKCTLRGFPRDARIWLDTTDPRFAHLTYSQNIELQGDGPTVTASPIQLLKAATVRGRLVNPETGGPVPGIELGAQATDGNPDAVGDTGTTDANGNFVITRMTPGAFVVSIYEQDNRSNDWTAAAVDVSVAEGDDKTIDIKLTRGDLLNGLVRDAKTYKPIPNVSVGLHGPAKPQHAASIYSRTTDADGRFEFRVPPGEQHPYIAGDVDGYLEPKKQGMQDITVQEGQTATVTFDLQPDPAPLVEGTVLGPDSKPVPGAAVLYNKEPGFPFGLATKTDAHGRFHLRATPGTTVRAQWKDLATTTATRIIDDSPLELNLEPNPTFTLIVHLVDEDGAPIPDGQARLTIFSGNYGIGGASHHADANGQITFGPLQTDTHFSIKGKAPGYGDASKDLKTIHPDAHKEVALTLHLKKATAVIAGIVIDQSGNPVPNAHIMLNGTDLQEQRSDAQGRFSFSVVDDAFATVFVRTDKGALTKPVQARAGNKEIKLLLLNPPSK